MKVANGKNIGTYSSNRVQESTSAAIALGFDGKRSTKVTAKIIPHTINKTNPTPAKKRFNKKLFNIFFVDIPMLFFSYVYYLIITCSFGNCKIKMKVYNLCQK